MQATAQQLADTHFARQHDKAIVRCRANHRGALRRLVGPITLWDEPRPDHVRLEAPKLTENLLNVLEGERSVLVAFPRGHEDVWTTAVKAPVLRVA
jgi:hypothetical protein